MPRAQLKATCLGATTLLSLYYILSLTCGSGYESRIHFSYFLPNRKLELKERRKEREERRRVSSKGFVGEAGYQWR